MKAIIGEIREKVNSVDCAVLVDCIRIGTDMSQGDGFTHYMVTALARSGRYITWRALYRRENGGFDLVRAGGRYDFESIESALCDMYDRARSALESAHWENVRQEGI